MNAHVTITTAAGLDAAALGAFFEQYLRRFPDAKLQVPELYLYQSVGITDDVFVLPEWRGIARWLVAEGLRWFRAQNVAQVRLEVRRTNPAAQAVYRSVGFEQINEEVLLGRMLETG